MPNEQNVLVWCGRRVCARACTQAYTKHDYEAARRHFEAALALCASYPDGLLRAWEPTITNLGHAYRQLNMLDEAVATYRRAKDLCPMNATVHASLAFATHLAGRRHEAIELYHTALVRACV